MTQRRRACPRRIRRSTPHERLRARYGAPLRGALPLAACTVRPAASATTAISSHALTHPNSRPSLTRRSTDFSRSACGIAPKYGSFAGGGEILREADPASQSSGSGAENLPALLPQLALWVDVPVERVPTRFVQKYTLTKDSAGEGMSRMLLN